MRRPRSRLLALGLVAVLLAPARAQDAAPAQDAVAALTSHVYELVLRRGAPYIELDVGGARGLFLVDTGANTSGVDRAWLERSGARWRPGGGTTVGGTTGAVNLDLCVIDRFDLGTGFFRDVKLTMQRLEHFAAPTPGKTQIGLLGTDLLNRYQVSFDWVRSRLEVRLPRERRAPPPGHEAIACAYPINLPTVGVRLAADAGALGLPCRLDTGATYLDQTPRLDVNVAAVEALRARGVTLVPAGSITVRGISGPERLEVLAVEGDGLVFELGPARIEGVQLVVHTKGTLAVRHPLALASATLLSRLHRLTFDPFDHLLWVPLPEPRRGPRLGPL